METLNSDYDKLQKSNNKLQKLCENLEDEKMYLQDELGRILKEAELRYNYLFPYFSTLSTFIILVVNLVKILISN